MQTTTGEASPATEELERLQGSAARLIECVRELRARLGEPEAFERDIREAEQAGAAFAAMIEALRTSAPVGMAWLDREFRFVRVNEALARMNDLPIGEHLGRTLAEVAPEVWAQIEDLCRTVIETGESLNNVEVIGEGTTGRRGHWLSGIYPVRMDGAIVGIGFLVIDVSERFAADEFRTVVTETMVEGLYALDCAGRLTYMNAAASAMLGWEAEELMDRNVHETIHFLTIDGALRPESECLISGVRAGGPPVRQAADVFIRRDGSLIPVTYSAAPLKGSGGEIGVVVVFRDTTEERADQLRVQRELDALHWLGRTREAIDEDRLVLYAQPIIPLGDGEPSEELLIRMITRDGEVVPPARFLPVAERFGLIGEIDRWAIARAARRAAAGHRVEVNLSAKSIDVELVGYIEAELHVAGADPSYVTFELTETALLENVSVGRQFAAELHAIGCGLALDDFGTGYASLTHLRVLPAQLLKIDIEFVRDLPRSDTNQHLVKSIVHLAQGLGKQTVAEGVEDEATLELLRSFGVGFAQGFHIGRPAPLD